MMMSSIAAAALLASVQLAAPYQPGQGGAQRVAPRGDYTQTCSGAYVNQGRLYADCRDRRGEIRGTSIMLNQCGDYEIQNTDGRLTCGRFQGDYEGGRPGNGGGNGGGWNPGNGNGPGRPDRPGGGWNPGRPDRPGAGNGGWGRDHIVVYRDSNFRGESRELRGEIGNLENERFNDVISSMRFVGTWEACTDSYFRGQCQTFTDSVSNLGAWGMNDKISSIRPVRRGW